MMKPLALVVVLLALVAASPASGKGGDLYALRYGAQMNLLVPYDPVRIVPSGPSIRLGQFAHAWSISPNRSRFAAAASSWRATKGGSTALRFVDLASGRIEGSVRTAATLPDGRILVSGYEFGMAGSTTLQLVNPKDWSSHALTLATSWFRVGGGRVFTHGARGTGLRILKPSGLAIELFPGRSVGNVFVVGPRAFVTFFGTNQKAAVIALGTGRVIRQTLPAHPLIGAGQPIFVG